MIFSALLGGVAITALTPVVLPLLRPVHGAPDSGQFDRAVYLDQLKELDRDVSRGVVGPAAAAAARLEIQRRLLAADSRPASAVSSRRSPVMAAAIVLFAGGGAAVLYGSLGSPGVSDIVFVTRSAMAGEVSPPTAVPEHGDLQQAAVRLAEKLKTEPGNADRWVLYAKTSGSLRHWDDAADAYRHAIALGSAGPDIQVGLGEMLVMQTDGIVAPAAHNAFVAALKDDPKNAVARYYMALAAGQAGQAEDSIRLMQALAADTPEDSPMRDEIGKRIAEAAKAAGLPLPELAKGTPAEDPDSATAALDAADAMPEGAQKAMITAMVDKLATRLQTEPGDVDGWMRLGRAYTVMRDPAKAADAYDHAVALMPGDAPIRLQAVEALLTGLKPADALPPRAVALLREVEAISPDEPEVLWYLGVNAARDAHPDDARRYWARLLAKLPAEGENTRMVKSAMEALNKG